MIIETLTSLLYGISQISLSSGKKQKHQSFITYILIQNYTYMDNDYLKKSVSSKERPLPPQFIHYEQISLESRKDFHQFDEILTFFQECFGTHRNPQAAMSKRNS